MANDKPSFDHNELTQSSTAYMEKLKDKDQLYGPPPKEPFRIDQLWTDTRYRSNFIQVIAFILFIAAVFWLVNNARINLAALGKPINFTFLGEPASYDINQRLIDYTSRDPHWKAAVVGILNTLLVAFLGCIIATVIGVTAGVLRLSKNFAVSSLMAAYIEGVRNVPVLLQILLLYGVFIFSLPKPKQAVPMLGDAFVATNRGFYVPSPSFGEGSLLLGLVFLASLVAIFLMRRWAKRRQQATGQQFPTFIVSVLLFFVPTIVAFYLLGKPVSWIFPELKGFNFKGGIHMRTSLVALTLALAIYTGAFIAENVRSGIQAVSGGQTEAANALALKSSWVMRLVVLPQALRVIIPPLISQYLNLTKNSSLAIAVGYMDATGTLGGITLNQTGREMESILLLMAFYLTVSLLISSVMNWYNRSVSLVER